MNQGLINELRILEKEYQRTKDFIRESSYQNAINAIKRFNKPITNDNLKDVKNLKGIGKSIAAKIKQFIDTGEITKAQEFKERATVTSHKSVEEDTKDKFRAIWGVSDAGANKLWDADIRSIDDLKQRQNLLNNQQKIGLKYYNDIMKKVPRKYITTLSIAIQYILTNKFGEDSFKFKVCGSYRRGEEQSGDMDVIIMSEVFTPEEAITTLKDAGIIAETLSFKNVKFMGIAHCLAPGAQDIRLDIAFANQDNWGAMLLYFTGTKGLNKEMRFAAKSKGLLLNEYGLFKGKTQIPAFTEEEIFEELGYEYIPPNLR